MYYSKRKDHRSRKDRVERQIQAWREILPHLVKAYLLFQKHGPPVKTANDGRDVSWTMEVVSLEGCFRISIRVSCIYFFWQVVESDPSIILPTQCLRRSPFWNMVSLERHPYSPSWVLQSRHYIFTGNYDVSVLVSALTHFRRPWISIMPWVTKF